MALKLYYFAGACSLSPHIVAREAGVPIELEKFIAETGKTASGEDYAASVTPKGYVPALRLEDGSVLTEGAAIVQLLADKAPEKRLIPAVGTIERYRTLEWLNYIASELHKGFYPLFVDGHTEEQKQAARAALAPKFAFVEKALQGKQFLFGDRFDVADAYLFTVLSWTKYVGIQLSAALGDYLGRVAARPAVQEALKAEGLAK